MEVFFLHSIMSAPGSLITPLRYAPARYHRTDAIRNAAKGINPCAHPGIQHSWRLNASVTENTATPERPGVPLARGAARLLASMDLAPLAGVHAKNGPAG